MPQKDIEFKPLKIIINGEVIDLPENIPEFNFETDKVETSELEDEFISFNKNYEFTFSAKQSVDSEFLRSIGALYDYKGKYTVKAVSAPCDGTAYFLHELFQKLIRMGCVISGWEYKEIDNPRDKRYTTVFTVYGYFYNTNNWRKMHGVPMKRRIKNVSYRKSSKKSKQTRRMG